MQKCNHISVVQSPIKTDCPLNCNGTYCTNCPLTKNRRIKIIMPDNKINN